MLTPCRGKKMLFCHPFLLDVGRREDLFVLEVV